MKQWNIPTRPRKGQKFSEETKKKMSVAHLGNTRGFQRGVPSWNKGLTTKTDKRIRKYGRKIAVTYQDKTRTPAWRGGISYEPYSLDFTPSIKRIVKERD